MIALIIVDVIVVVNFCTRNIADNRDSSDSDENDSSDRVSRNIFHHVYGLLICILVDVAIVGLLDERECRRALSLNKVNDDYCSD